MVAVDCNGLSSVTQAIDTWPVVLITAPLNQYLGGAFNPYAYAVPNATAPPPGIGVRCRRSQPGPVSARRRQHVASHEPRGDESRPLGGDWDASALPAGDHTIEVQAVGSTTRSHTITVAVTGPANGRHGPERELQYPACTPCDSGLRVLENDSDPDGDCSRTMSVRRRTGPHPNADGSLPTRRPSLQWGGQLHLRGLGRCSGATPATVTIAVTAATDTSRSSRDVYEENPAPDRRGHGSAQPNAALTVVGYGSMIYNTKTKKYTYQTTVTSAPETVTVLSSKDGRRRRR